MAEETLLTAARRIVREFNITMQEGGLVNAHLEQAFNTLDKQVRLQIEREKSASRVYTLHETVDYVIEKTSLNKKSLGWFISIEGANESFFISHTKPDLNAQDKIEITIRLAP